MTKLHIRQHDPVAGFYPIRLTLKRDGQPDLEAEAKIEFSLTPQEQNDLRWYLEDYLQNRGDAEAIVAQQVELLIQSRGEELYEKILAANENTRALWYSIRNELANLRVEVATGIVEAASIPWELMRDPMLKSPIALRVKSFVRVQSNPNISFVPVPQTSDGRVRLLYIASRPGGAADIELRAVANRLLRDLGQDRSRFDIKALRPPTFEQLQEELNDAREAGRPYHIVHFDGHGTYEDLSTTSLAHWAAALPNLAPDDESRKRGYLLFEHPGEDSVRPIDGETLGQLLHDCVVSVLVLNACQSAMHESTTVGNGAANVHDEFRAIGSLAQAVIDQGIPAVLGMRYSVFVVTAAQYIGQLYAALAKGRSFGQAATEGRKHLQRNPERWIGLEPRPLQDWFVPVAYEAVPIKLLPDKQTVSLNEQMELDPVQNNRALLRYVPEEGFVGRDETLLALDRAFDDHRVVLLHAYAGQGKSSTAVEFARWYALTGGLGEQPLVLLASFESHTDLDDLLNQIAQPFSPALEAQGIYWSALNEPDKRRRLVIQILRQFPILWIWDNVETVAGFPEGTESQWTTDEQTELRYFLKQIKLDNASKVRILLTSRRDEQKWLGGIPHRIQMSRMRNSDAARLAFKLGEEKNLSRSEIANWQPLLEYCAGNPLTIRVLVGQAVRAKLSGSQQISDFVDAIRNGEQQIEDADEEQGRDKSLGASLNYGFRNAFKDEELPIVALLRLFQGTVDVDVLKLMRLLPERPLPELQGKSENDFISLLEQAKDIGVLTKIGPAYFTIHPALPWFLHQLFTRYYNGVAGNSKGEIALRSWVDAIGWLSSSYFRQFQDGHRDVVKLLEIEESNLLHAWQIARANQWWDRVISCMQGLHVLYDYRGRLTEWARLVEKIRPDYCTPDNEPLEGKEDHYGVVMGYRVQLAVLYEHDIQQAVTLQEQTVNFSRERAAFANTLPLHASLDNEQQYLLLSLATDVAQLGSLRAQTNNPTCVEDFQEAIANYKRLGNRVGEAIAEWNLGNAYKDVPNVRDFDAAEAAFRRSLDLHSSNDLWGRSKCIRQIGLVHYERFDEARQRGESSEILVRHIKAAQEHYSQALSLCPNDALPDLSLIHNNLGTLYSETGHLKNAREHYELSAQLEERVGNRHGAGDRRFNLAVTYGRAALLERDAPQKRANLERARAYAEAALRDYEFYGGRAASDEGNTRTFLNQINEILSALTE